ncbi:MAG: HAD family hydrolase [Candidatus Poseidoniales archaeon]|tara:strand:- start:47 stop:661 length:615 start_codon:yes stop_codon:yes gene_type:complete
MKEILVVFDLDGTLVDSAQAILESHEAAWKSVNAKCPPKEEILKLTGLPLIEIMQKLGPEYDSQTLANTYSQTYVEATQHERLFEGITELLAKPFRAAVATGKSQRGANRIIKHFGFENRFEVILGGDSVPNPKPNPDLLLSIMKTTRTKNIVMIGDTTYDLEMANAAGVKGIGVSWGHHSSEELRKWAPVVNSVEELVRFLKI